MTPLEVYQAGLCSVMPTIEKNCQNDWISKNGTCYEDSCCTSFETATSWYYRLAQCSHVLFSFIGTLLVALYLWKFSSKHMLPDNVRIFVGIMLFLIVTHSVDMISFHIYHLLQSLRVSPSDPCSVRVKVSFCAPFRYTYTYCTLSLAACQYCVYIDRLICAFSRKYERYQKVILIVLIAQLIVLTMLTVAWMYRNEEPDFYLLSCINLPPTSTRDMAMATALFFPINFICFFLSIFLFRVFKKKEKGSRFDIARHFTAAVDVESSEFLYRLTRTQAAIMAVFSVVSLAMRFTYYSVPRSVGLTMATFSYIFSIYSTIVPFVMIRYARGTSRNRRSKISSQVGLKSVGSEGADNYFGMMKSQWE